MAGIPSDLQRSRLNVLLQSVHGVLDQRHDACVFIVRFGCNAQQTANGAHGIGSQLFVVQRSVGGHFQHLDPLCRRHVLSQVEVGVGVALEYQCVAEIRNRPTCTHPHENGLVVLLQQNSLQHIREKQRVFSERRKQHKHTQRAACRCSDIGVCIGCQREDQGHCQSLVSILTAELQSTLMHSSHQHTYVKGLENIARHAGKAITGSSTHRWRILAASRFLQIVFNHGLPPRHMLLRKFARLVNCTGIRLDEFEAGGWNG